MRKSSGPFSKLACHSRLLAKVCSLLNFSKEVLCVVCFCFFAKQAFAEYKYEHLPLIKKCSPILHSPCFVIVCLNTGMAVHEKNSAYKIHIDEEHGKKSLREIAETVDTLKTRSYMSGTTFCSIIKNKYDCVFKVVLSGINSDQELDEDIKKLKSWLDQFAETTINKKHEVVANGIPLLFCSGIKNSIDMVLPYDIKIIISDKINNQITKNIKYKTVVGAPVTKNNTTIGFVSVYTSLFANPSVFQINAIADIKRGSRIGVVCDSMRYLIFGN